MGSMICCTTFEHQEVATSVQIPGDWKLISANAGQIDEPFVRFYIPPDFVERKAKHDFMGQSPKFYGNENVYLVFTIHTPYKTENDFSKQNNFRLERTIIDGKKADISTFTGTEMFNEAEGKNYVAILEITEIQGKTKNLSMWAYGKTQEDRENVIKIFKSVRFSDE